jgi:hypothetical protein
MNYHLAEQMARDRVREARQIAAQANLLRDLGNQGEPLRVTVGLGLIKVGRWMAGRTAKGQTSRRATA